MIPDINKLRVIKADKHCPSCGKKKSIKLIDQKIKSKLFRIITILTYECSKCGHVYKKKIE